MKPVVCPTSLTVEKVVAVTVTYGDRFALLQAVAERVLAQPGIERWVIVTNGVPSHRVREIQALDARVLVRSFPTNVGSAPAYATGIEAAMATAAEWVWLLDDDNLPAPDALQRLVAAHRALSRAAARAAGVAVCAYREAIHAPQLRRGPRPASSFLGFDLRAALWRRSRRQTPPGEPPQAHRVASAPYGGLLLPRALIARAGLPDARFVLYADDTEYTDRIVRGGGRLYVIRDALITDLEPSWQQRPSLLRAWLDEPDGARVYYGVRNEVWFDCHRLVRSRWLYRLHRAIYLGAWWLLSRREPRRSRFGLLHEAVRAGEAGALGPDPRFTQPSPAAPVAP